MVRFFADGFLFCGAEYVFYDNLSQFMPVLFLSGVFCTGSGCNGKKKKCVRARSFARVLFASLFEFRTKIHRVIGKIGRAFLFVPKVRCKCALPSSRRRSVPILSMPHALPVADETVVSDDSRRVGLSRRARSADGGGSSHGSALPPLYKVGGCWRFAFCCGRA